MIPPDLCNFPFSLLPRLLLGLSTNYVHSLPNSSSQPCTAGGSGGGVHTLVRRDIHDPDHRAQFIVFSCLIPVLVLLSGVFAGLTLGYMSLDETQLNVLSVSGTPQQKVYANKIKPIRKNGHLLLVTLLLANMIVNETLPVISDPILGGGVQSVVVSTVLIVMYVFVLVASSLAPMHVRAGLSYVIAHAAFTFCLSSMVHPRLLHLVFIGLLFLSLSFPVVSRSLPSDFALRGVPRDATSARPTRFL